MKNVFILIFIAIECFSLMTGCIMYSDAYYTAETAKWQAKQAASEAWAEAANRPLATLTATSGEVLTVNNPMPVQPMAVMNDPNPWVQGANTILNSTAAKIVGGGWAAGYMMGKVQGNYTTGDGGSINVTRDSGNPVDVTTRHVEDGGAITETNHTNSDYDASQADVGNDKSMEDYDQRHDYDQENINNDQPDNSGQDQRAGDYIEYGGVTDSGNSTTSTSTSTTQPGD